MALPGKRLLFPRRIQVHDPAAVTTISERETDPREVGLKPAAVEAIWQSVVTYYKVGLHPALALCIRRRGRVVLDRAIGHSHGNAPDQTGTPLQLATPDSLYNLYSASKCALAMLVHQADDQGLVHLDDPVCEYLPDFGRHGKHTLTLRHVLTHRAGVPSLPGDEVDLKLLADPVAVLERLCDAKLETQPGRKLAYHAVTGGFVLAAVLKAVTGQDLRTLLDKQVREPLGLKTFTYGVRPDQAGQVARCAFTGPRPPRSVAALLEKSLGVSVEEVVRISNEPDFLTAVVPSANIIGTPNEIGRYFECLRQGGSLDGVTVFPARTIRRAVAEQSYHELDDVIKLPIRYGMGFMLGADHLSFFGPNTPRAYGHLGFSNVMAWADPDRELSVAFLNTGKPILTPEVALWLRIMRVIARRVPRDGPQPQYG